MLFAADAHLSADAPARNARFFAFLDGAARRARALFLLGDIFDVWVGDDDDTPPAAEAKAALAALTAAGVPVFIQRGNHDFLLGGRFMRDTGCSLLPDEYVLETDGGRWLLTHGDQFAADPVYQRYRRWRPLLSAAAVVLSLPMRRRLAGKLGAVSNTAPEALDDAKCVAALRRRRCSAMIFGHLHGRGDSRLLQGGGGELRCFCLPDWEGAPGYAELDGGQVRFIDA